MCSWHSAAGAGPAGLVHAGWRHRAWCCAALTSNKWRPTPLLVSLCYFRNELVATDLMVTTRELGANGRLLLRDVWPQLLQLGCSFLAS